MYEFFIREGLISVEQYELALDLQKNLGIRFQDALLKLGMLKEEKIIRYCKKVLGEK